MGLDLILYKKDKNKNIEDMSMEEELDSELAYGRKTWAIANFFRRRCKTVDRWEYVVTKRDWDAFIKNLDDLNNPSFRDKIENYINVIHNYECNELKLTLEKVEDIMSSYNELESWLDMALENDNGYTLGFDWELQAVLCWFDANEEIQQVFKDGIDVRLIVSY